MPTEAKSKPVPARTRPKRVPLTRERVLRAGLRLVDERGLDALTMRALGERLGVEAMSLYNHVPGKQAMRDGIRDLLWAELADTIEPGADWRQTLRALAVALRRLAAEHPQAFPVLLAGRITPAPGLRAFQAQLDSLSAAGFDRPQAANALRAVFGYACGYAMIDLSCFSVTSSGEPGFDVMLALARSLPGDLPSDLADIAREVCLCEPDRQFEVGLEALLAGLDPACRTRKSPPRRLS
jgi:TetR/AcrR family tetracycline transcriptional repressor